MSLGVKICLFSIDNQTKKGGQIIKPKYIIILSIVTVILIFILRVTPRQNSGLLIKHISLFIVSSLWLFIAIHLGTSYWLNKTSSPRIETRLIILRTLMIASGILLLLVIQLSYFDKQTTFYDYRCEYYDKHYNLIFSNPRIHHCPDLTIQTNTADTLIFTTASSYNGYDDLSSYEQVGLSKLDEETTLFVSSDTITTIHYNDDFDIIYYETQLSEIITYQEASSMDTQYFSQSTIVENTLASNAFSTRFSTATIFKEYTDESMLHYSFNEDDYETVTTYTSQETTLDTSDINPDYYILQSTNELNTSIVGYGLYSNYIFLNVLGALKEFTYLDISNWTQTEGTYYRVQSGERIKSEGINERHYSLGYDLQEEGYYTLMSKQFQEPDQYRFISNRSWSFGNITFTEDGHHCYHVLDGIYYKFIETDYGLKVVDRRNQQYSVFKSLEKQQLDTDLDYFNDQFLQLHDYYQNMTNYPYHVPKIIIKESNPFFLMDLIK